MPHEIFFKLEGSEYGEGIMLNEYNDVYSLIVAQEPQAEGTVFMRWCYPQGKDKGPIDKSIPMGVKLGSHRQAKKALEFFLTQLGAKDGDTPF